MGSHAGAREPEVRGSAGTRGNHAEIEGLYICAGHFRNGFVLGPASARLVVDLILDRQPQLAPGPTVLRWRKQKSVCRLGPHRLARDP